MMKVLARILVVTLVLAVGLAVSVALVKTGPKTERKPPPRQARLVAVTPVVVADQRVVVHAMGTVKPAREVAVQPRVAGQVVKLSEEFVPGGHFAEGAMVLQLDQADFVLAVRQRESDWEQAKSALELELGQQTVARREFEMLGEPMKEDDRALVLRQPQLAKAQAALDAAKAALDLAKLNLERSTVTAPFAATVRERHVNVGMQVTPSTVLATLSGTDAYWIELAVPVDELKWIETPRTGTEQGALARVYSEAAWRTNTFREGRVVRLLNDLEKDGRMARLLVEVGDPEALSPANKGKPPLLLGDYVRVEIEGIELKAVAALDRQWIRDGRFVWLMDAGKKLEVRPVEVVFRGRDRLLVRDGLRAGEQVVVTDLASPVAGMLLRTADASNPEETSRP